MFNLKNTVEGGKYIRPGINEVVIDSVEGQEPEGRSSFIEMKFRLPNSTSEESTSIRMYMSEKARISSEMKLKHIATKVTTLANIEAIEAASLQEFGAKLNKVLSNKPLRMKFTAEEYVNSKGEIKTKPSIPNKAFAEATREGAEYPVVPANQSQLRFDPSNRFDYKKLEAGPEGNSAIVNKDEDLPF